MYKCTTHFVIEIAVAFNRLVIVFPSTRIYPPPPSFLRRSVCSLALSFAFSSFSPCFPSLFADDTLAPSSPLPSLAGRIEQAEINVCVCLLCLLDLLSPHRYATTPPNQTPSPRPAADCWSFCHSAFLPLSFSFSFPLSVFPLHPLPSTSILFVYDHVL